MKTLTTLFISTCVSMAHCEEGYVYIGDINGDGIDDKIESGPRNLFGTGGGPWVLALSGKHEIKINIGGSIVFALEKENNLGFSRLWTFWHSSSGSGNLISYKIGKDNIIEKQELSINPGDSGSQLGNSLYDAIFNKTFILNFNHVKNYIPPNSADGVEWGK